MLNNGGNRVDGEMISRGRCRALQQWPARSAAAAMAAATQLRESRHSFPTRFADDVFDVGGDGHNEKRRYGKTAEPTSSVVERSSPPR